VTRRAGRSDGAIAWIATESRTTGTYKGKTIDLTATETMILRRAGGTWKIVHIHWSSTAKR
jgi:ketosteroid isomerase-like protein